MWFAPLIFLVGAVAAKNEEDPVADQLVKYKKQHPQPIGVLSTSSGRPLDLKETSTLNTNLVTSEYFLDYLTHFVRERIPERVVHTKGAGAFGYFEVTHNITDVCKAKLFGKVGKKTPIVVRFSPVSPERGVSDLVRGARGFAIKFKTEEGNFDLVGINRPMFSVKDPVLFPTFARTAQKNPVTHVADPNIQWDVLTSHPESLFEFLLTFGDSGIPDGYRHIPGYSIHTYQVANQNGDLYFMRICFLPNAGIKNILSEEAKKIEDVDYATRDLYQAIEKGEYPSWNMSIQVLSLNDVKNAGFDVFDTSKILPLEEYPFRPVGRLVLNKNPKNYFADIEQLAFNPANYVDGIYGAPDKVFEARRLVYREAQYYRLGGNYDKIPINCPLKAFTYNRDGVPPVGENGEGAPNYFPNTFNGPQPNDDKNRIELIKINQDKPDNFKQARDWYLNEMTNAERSRLIKTIVSSLGLAAKNLQERAVKLYTNIYPELGNKIAAGLNSTQTQQLRQYGIHKHFSDQMRWGKLELIARKFGKHLLKRN